MEPLRRDDLDAVFLDAGNTLISIDHDLLVELLAAEGVRTTAGALLRAEAAARPALSRFVAAGGSTERRDAFTFQVRRILATLGVEASEVPALADRFVTTIRRDVGTMRLWSRLLPGIPEALAALRDAGLRVVVVSNSDGTVERQLEQLALRPLLDGVIDSAIVGAEKPDPAIFRHALERAGSRPERTLHVGDLYAVDVVGARRAGLHALLLDPFDDWADDVDCPRGPDVLTLARALRDGGAAW
jgi:HAD superfamily hydrolase (TIGR01662 family)